MCTDKVDTVPRFPSSFLDHGNSKGSCSRKSFSIYNFTYSIIEFYHISDGKKQSGYCSKKWFIVRNQTLPWKRNIVKFQFKEKEEERIIISIE
jgi:hypothetical protein